MALSGITVLEFAGLAPVPFCGMMLADFGADVVRVDRVGNEIAVSGNDLLARGKKSIALNLKHPDAVQLILDIIPKVDVLIEPYRPGVMEKLGLGPEVLMKLNPKLVFARLTGFGQTGPLKDRAGHDINYLATSGMLSTFKRRGEKPMFPGNVLADFAAGSLTCAFGIVTALYEQTVSGKGQIIDSSIVDGTLYLGSFVNNSTRTPVWNQPPGENILDSGAPNYEVYETKDGKYMAVGPLEPQFYRLFLKGLGLDTDSLPSVFDREHWPHLKEIFTKKFMSKTREEWVQIFGNTDACVTPVLELCELADHPHIKSRQLFSDSSIGLQPSPSPKLSRTPAQPAFNSPTNGSNSLEVLKQFGIQENRIQSLVTGQAVFLSSTANIRSKL